jgi:mono/diheme cytochrome c family protein
MGIVLAIAISGSQVLGLSWVQPIAPGWAAEIPVVAGSVAGMTAGITTGITTDGDKIISNGIINANQHDNDNRDNDNRDNDNRDNDNSVDGAKIFANSCSTCHIGGINVLIGHKNLEQEALEKFAMDSIEAIQHQVTHGKNAMPAFGKRLSAEEITAVADYVLRQAQSGW